MAFDHIIYVAAISFRAPSLYTVSCLCVRIIRPQYQMTVPRTLGFIHMDRPRVVIISWYRVLWRSVVVRRGGRLFREFNSIMIIEKPIAVRPRRRSRTKQTSGDLSTPPPSQPTSVHPVCDYFFLISAPYPLPRPPHSPRPHGPPHPPRPDRFSIFILPR